MAVGKSRRIVIDVDDVELKRRLHSALAGEGRSLKEWFVITVGNYLDTKHIHLTTGLVRPPKGKKQIEHKKRVNP